MPRKTRRSHGIPAYSYNPGAGYQSMPSGRGGVFGSAEPPPRGWAPPLPPGPPPGAPAYYSYGHPAMQPPQYSIHYPVGAPPSMHYAPPLPPGPPPSEGSMIPLQIIPLPGSSYKGPLSVPAYMPAGPGRSLGPPPANPYEKSVGSSAPAPSRGPLIQDPTIQLFTFITISAIHEFLYSSKIREGVAKIRGSDAHLEKKMLREVYSFFLKGGAAPSILEHFFEPEFMLPLPIEADIDTTLLVNPAEPKFLDIRNFLIHALIRFLSDRLLASPDGWEEIVGIYREHGLALDRRETGIRIKGATDTDGLKLFSGAEGLVTGDKYLTDFRFPAECPFKLEVQASVSFGRSTVGLTILKVLTKTSPAVDLLDIAIPNSEFKLLDFEWKTKKLLPFKLLDAKIHFYISDLFTTLADQRVGVRLDTRRNKVARREARAARLARTIRNLQARGMVKSKVAELNAGILGATMPNGTPFGALIENME